MNDEPDFLARIIYDLFYSGKTLLSKTAEFKLKQHNKDLVPGINNKLNQILGCFDRYRRNSYDIQGIRDHGIDILIKYDHDSEKKLIGVQVKSYSDLNVKDWLSKLKAQMLDLQTHWKPESITDFYLVFCTDVEKHKDKIRNATADLVNLDSFNIHIVNPEEALHFMGLSNFYIGAYMKRKYSEGDPVIIEAQESLSGLSLAQSAMIIEAASCLIENRRLELSHDDVAESSFVQEVYENYPNLPGEYFECDDDEINNLNIDNIDKDPLQDLSYLVDRGRLELPTYTETVALDLELYVELLAIMYDAKARYNYDFDENKWYTFSLLKDLEIEISTKFIRSHEHPD